jgi:endonuclease YncB( thermonuclease family)
MRRRRIFKPLRTARRPGRTVALLASLSLVGVLATVLNPGALLGSAPRSQEWRALPVEVAVLDGETLRLGERVLRLHGLAAPARGTSCGAVGDCGAAAAAELARLVRNQALECRIYGRDGFGRGLGQCRAGGLEVNAALVTGGWASAVGTPFALAEAEARRAGRGIWAEATR